MQNEILGKVSFAAQYAKPTETGRETWEEAVDIAEGPDVGLPEAHDSYYLDGSFQINYCMVEFYKKDEKDYVKELEN